MLQENKDLLKKFGPVWCASGAQGFFGEGYSYHKYLKPFGLTFDGVTLVSKTTTAFKNEGNMKTKADGVTPEEFLPRCVYVSPRSWVRASALNVVGLSNPGTEKVIQTGRLQKMTAPFFLSIMAIGKTRIERKMEMSYFWKYLYWFLGENPHLRDLLGLQINYSCPNTGENLEGRYDELVAEAKEDMEFLGGLGIPMVPKINVALPVEKAVEIGNDPNCAGLTLSNTILWDDLPKFGIDRKKIFGSDTSPLLGRGFSKPGGYSGYRLLPLVARYVEKMRELGFKKHINAGGGILGPSCVYYLQSAGANSFSLGSMAFLRPWRMKATIKKAYALCR